MAVGVFAKELASEFRRRLNGESLRGGWDVGREAWF